MTGRPGDPGGRFSLTAGRLPPIIATVDGHPRPACGDCMSSLTRTLRDIRRWWRQVDEHAVGLRRGQAGHRLAAPPGWRLALQQASVAELKANLPEARGALAEAARQVPAGPWRRVLQLIRYRIEVRQASHARLRELIGQLGRLVRSRIPGKKPRWPGSTTFSAS